MIGCLQLYLEKGLIKSKFVNLKVRQLSAETSHDFIEWCGLIDGAVPNRTLAEGGRLSMQTLYEEFVHEYPDYSPRAKYSISRTRFYRWLISYCIYKDGQTPQNGRDASGKWIILKPIEDVVPQQTIEF